MELSRSEAGGLLRTLGPTQSMGVPWDISGKEARGSAIVERCCHVLRRNCSVWGLLSVPFRGIHFFFPPDLFCYPCSGVCSQERSHLLYFTLIPQNLTCSAVPFPAPLDTPPPRTLSPGSHCALSHSPGNREDHRRAQ